MWPAVIDRLGGSKRMEWVAMKPYQDPVILIMHCPNNFSFPRGIWLAVSSFKFAWSGFWKRKAAPFRVCRLSFLLLFRIPFDRLNFITYSFCSSRFYTFIVSMHSNPPEHMSTAHTPSTEHTPYVIPCVHRVIARPKCRFVLLDHHSDWSCMANIWPQSKRIFVVRL